MILKIVNQKNTRQIDYFQKQLMTNIQDIQILLAKQNIIMFANTFSHLQKCALANQIRIAGQQHQLPKIDQNKTENCNNKLKFLRNHNITNNILFIEKKCNSLCHISCKASSLFFYNIFHDGYLDPETEENERQARMQVQPDTYLENLLQV